MHFGNLLVERTTGERNVEGIDCDAAVRIVNTFRTTVFVALVTQNAVMNLAENLTWSHSRVCQRESIPATQPILRPDQLLRKCGVGALMLHEVEVINGFRKPETNPVAIRGIVQMHRTPLLQCLEFG